MEDTVRSRDGYSRPSHFLSTREFSQVYLGRSTPRRGTSDVGQSPRCATGSTHNDVSSSLLQLPSSVQTVPRLRLCTPHCEVAAQDRKPLDRGGVRRTRSSALQRALNAYAPQARSSSSSSLARRTKRASRSQRLRQEVRATRHTNALDNAADAFDSLFEDPSPTRCDVRGTQDAAAQGRTAFTTPPRPQVARPLDAACTAGDVAAHSNTAETLRSRVVYLEQALTQRHRELETLRRDQRVSQVHTARIEAQLALSECCRLRSVLKARGGLSGDRTPPPPPTVHAGDPACHRTDELADLLRRNQELERRLAVHASDADAADARIRELQQKLQHTAVLYSDTQAKCAQAAAVAERYSAEAAALRKEVHLLQTLPQQVVRLQRDLDDARGQAVEADRLVGRYQQVLGDQSAASPESIRQLLTERNRLTDLLRQREQSEAALRQALDKCQLELSRQATSMKRTTAVDEAALRVDRESQLERQVQALQQHVHDLTSRLQSEREAASQELAHMRAEREENLVDRLLSGRTPPAATEATNAPPAPTATSAAAATAASSAPSAPAAPTLTSGADVPTPLSSPPPPPVAPEHELGEEMYGDDGFASSSSLSPSSSSTVSSDVAESEAAKGSEAAKSSSLSVVESKDSENRDPKLDLDGGSGLDGEAVPGTPRDDSERVSLADPREGKASPMPCSRQSLSGDVPHVDKLGDNAGMRTDEVADAGDAGELVVRVRETPPAGVVSGAAFSTTSSHSSSLSSTTATTSTVASSHDGVSNAAETAALRDGDERQAQTDVVPTSTVIESDVTLASAVTEDGEARVGDVIPPDTAAVAGSPNAGVDDTVMELVVAGGVATQQEPDAAAVPTVVTAPPVGAPSASEAPSVVADVSVSVTTGLADQSGDHPVTATLPAPRAASPPCTPSEVIDSDQSPVVAPYTAVRVESARVPLFSGEEVHNAHAGTPELLEAYSHQTSYALAHQYSGNASFGLSENQYARAQQLLYDHTDSFGDDVVESHDERPDDGAAVALFPSTFSAAPAPGNTTGSDTQTATQAEKLGDTGADGTPPAAKTASLEQSPIPHDDRDYTRFSGVNMEAVQTPPPADDADVTTTTPPAADKAGVVEPLANPSTELPPPTTAVVRPLEALITAAVAPPPPALPFLSVPGALPTPTLAGNAESPSESSSLSSAATLSSPASSAGGGVVAPETGLEENNHSATPPHTADEWVPPPPPPAAVPARPPSPPSVATDQGAVAASVQETADLLPSLPPTVTERVEASSGETAWMPPPPPVVAVPAPPPAAVVPVPHEADTQEADNHADEAPAAGSLSSPSTSTLPSADDDGTS